MNRTMAKKYSIYIYILQPGNMISYETSVEVGLGYSPHFPTNPVWCFVEGIHAMSVATAAMSPKAVA